MVLQIRYGEADGNTVPYPPLFDHVRGNHGYIDTVGRADRVADIPEARQSPALASLLRTFAGAESSLISVGCDLGQKEKPKGSFDTRRWAGGYVQVLAASANDLENEVELLGEMAKCIEQTLRRLVAADRWEIRFILTPIVVKLERERNTKSVWIWFDAKASTLDLALASRERLLMAIGVAISENITL